MDIRTATLEDLPTILALGKEFGHQMLYQKDPDVMAMYLDRILVAEEAYQWEGEGEAEGEKGVYPPRIVGFYHYIVSKDPGFEEMLRCYRQFPEELIHEAVTGLPYPTHTMTDRDPELCVIMQGGCHRDTARAFYGYLMERYSEIWCYCSIKSRRVDTYKDLGFTFSPEEQYSFFNIHAGRESTYQLGRWTRR